jgi:hypothetical protein
MMIHECILRLQGHNITAMRNRGDRVSILAEVSRPCQALRFSVCYLWHLSQLALSFTSKDRLPSWQ